MMTAYIALLLAVLHAVAGLSILIISTWFIAASAIAPIGFNYMIPAVVIRALALLRIASGYATKWLGHDDLLTRTAAERLRLFTALKHRRIEQKAWLTEALATHSQTVASGWISWIAPFCSAIVLNIVAIGAVAVLAMPGLTWLCFLAIAWTVLVSWLCVRGVQTALRQAQQEHGFRTTTDDFFRTSPVWHLMPAFRDTRSHKALPSARTLWRTRQHRDRRIHGAVWLFQGVAFALLLGVVSAQQMPMHTPLALVVPMLLLAAPDWLGASLAASRAFADERVSRRALSGLDSQPQRLLGRCPVTQQLSLKDFCASDRHVNPINAQLPPTGLVLVKGSSGSGKSSLLQALAGHLPCQGSREVDGVALFSGLVEDWLYVEQQPVVLAGSLKHNLDPASKGIDEDAMINMMKCLRLETLLPLDSWVGMAGRTLSGGEGKRLALARALLAKPDIMLVDEPFEGLDITSQQAVVRVLNELANTRLVLIASHLEPADLVVTQSLNTETPAQTAVQSQNHNAGQRKLC